MDCHHCYLGKPPAPQVRLEVSLGAGPSLPYHIQGHLARARVCLQGRAQGKIAAAQICVTVIGPVEDADARSGEYAHRVVLGMLGPYQAVFLVQV